MQNFRYLFVIMFAVQFLACNAQKAAVQKPAIKPAEPTKLAMSPELLWDVKRVTGLGLSKDDNYIVYKVSTPQVSENSFSSKTYKVNIQSGIVEDVTNPSNELHDRNLSPDGKYKLADRAVKVEPVHGFDFHPDLQKSTAQIYTSLDYRHWDTWNEGTYNHVLFGSATAADSTYKDILEGMPYNCPQKPFGGSEDYIWSPDSKSIVYVSKKSKGTQAVQSTNTDLYQYDIATGNTTNLTEANKGYDVAPSYSISGDLAYLSMATDGYEADKNDLKVISKGITYNLTAQWDESVQSFIWAKNGKNLYFTAAVDGTLQLFEVDVPGMTRKLPTVRQLTKGDWDVNDIIGLTGDLIIVSRVSMNRAAEIYSYNTVSQKWTQLTNVNTDLYKNIAEAKTERRYVTTTDGKQMLVWVVYPPGFDPNKKYPTLLYCQGGPQSALTQFYSYRWNLHLMASQGYIVVAPNRRGMPGHGVAWNHEISKDWGGQNIQDYLSAIDDVSKETYVDKSRLGAVGASYGGYSVFYLAGIHNKRFKTFIAHDGSFNLYSMYGSTEEIFFVNYDFGGPYWEEKNSKTYRDFNPVHHVQKWDTPIYIIQGGRDYRIPENQGLEAFTAAQLKGLKSKLLYLPDENHWVIKPQNSLVWQREFFKWLKETL